MTSCMLVNVVDVAVRVHLTRARSASPPHTPSVHTSTSKPERLTWSRSFFARALARDVPYDNELLVLVKMPNVDLLLIRHGER
jgi:hypothetical protein